MRKQRFSVILESNKNKNPRSKKPLYWVHIVCYAWLRQVYLADLYHLMNFPLFSNYIKPVGYFLRSNGGFGSANDKLDSL